MELVKTDVLDVFILSPKVFGDNRGYFMETWSKRKLEDAGLFYNFVQDNQSFSSVKGIIRGLHFQKGPYAQAKLVRCTKGAVLDVAVDLRYSSPTYKKWISVELSAENKKQLILPRGVAHGFLTLTDEVEFLYKVDNFYYFESEDGIRWDDPTLAIDWRIENPIVSPKDAVAPYFDQSRIYFD